MNKQEAIQLLEEMGLDASSRCPSCNEILVQKLKKTKNINGIQTIYKCSSCGQTFRLINCRTCRKKSYNYALNMCYGCFKKSKLSDLTRLKEQLDRDYKKLVLIKSRKKPDIMITISKELYNKLTIMSFDKGTSKTRLVLQAIKKLCS